MLTNKILITGASGAIGYWLSKECLKIGQDVTLVDNFINSKKDILFDKLIAKDNINFLNIDLCNLNDLKELKCEFDTIYHLAAYNGTNNFYDKPFDVLVNSTLPSINLLRWISESNKKPRFIYSSSSETYAGAVTHYNAKVPTDEDVHLVIDDPKNIRWSYGGSKLHGELAVFAAAEQYSIPSTVIRYHNVYGRRMGINHVIPDFIHRALNGVYKLNGAYDTRSFIHVKDAVNATVVVAESEKFISEIVNIGSEEEIMILDLARMIMELLDVTEDIEIFPSPKGSVLRRCPDLKKLKKVLPIISTIGLKDGLKEVIEDIKEGYKEIK